MAGLHSHASIWMLVRLAAGPDLAEIRNFFQKVKKLLLLYSLTELELAEVTGFPLQVYSRKGQDLAELKDLCLDV